MGACLGKKSSKYSYQTQSKAKIISTLPPKDQDATVETKSSPTLSKKDPVTDGLTVNHHDDDDEYRTSKIEETSIDSDLQLILDEQRAIDEILAQHFPLRIVSVTDTELEYELSHLMYDYDPAEHLPVVDNTPKSDSKE